MAYWLFKSEPDAYSIKDLQQEQDGIGRWDGIRNYQARNLLRDEVKMGDGVLFYHSSCKNVGIAGYAQVVSAPYPDPLQFDPESKYFDPKSSPDNPRWVCLDIQYIEDSTQFVSLKNIKATAELSDMVLVNRSRLSIQPVTESQWNRIKSMTLNH